MEIWSNATPQTKKTEMWIKFTWREQLFTIWDLVFDFQTWIRKSHRKWFFFFCSKMKFKRFSFRQKKNLQVIHHKIVIQKRERAKKKVVRFIRLMFVSQTRSGCSLIISVGRSNLRKKSTQWIVCFFTNVRCLHNRKSINLNFIVIYGHGFKTKKIGLKKKASNLACLRSSWVHYLPLWMRFNGQRPKNRLKINFYLLLSLSLACALLSEK